MFKEASENIHIYILWMAVFNFHNLIVGVKSFSYFIILFPSTISCTSRFGYFCFIYYPVKYVFGSVSLTAHIILPSMAHVGEYNICPGLYSCGILILLHYPFRRFLVITMGLIELLYAFLCIKIYNIVMDMNS